MKKPWLLVAWLLVIELLAILLLIHGDWTDRAIKRESVLVEQSLGVEARDWIQNKSIYGSGRALLIQASMRGCTKR